jgi:hypothetical protein
MIIKYSPFAGRERSGEEKPPRNGVEGKAHPTTCDPRRGHDGNPPHRVPSVWREEAARACPRDGSGG